MNRFIIDHHPGAIAKQLCDKHIVKMPTEEAQMLCTTIRQYAPDYADEHELYKTAHPKHPCTIWAGKTRANFMFAYELYEAMLNEYKHRFMRDHGAGNPSTTNPLASSEHIRYASRFIPEGSLTPHPECFGEHTHLVTKQPWPVDSYRQYYIVDKMDIALYNNGRDMPMWLLDAKNKIERTF